MKKYTMMAALLALGLSGVKANELKKEETVDDVKSEEVLRVLEEGLKEACSQLENCDTEDKKVESRGTHEV